jgi:hypothetical protein
METVAHFTTENSIMPSNDILSIAIQESTGEVFIGTGQGLVSYMSDATQTEDNYNNFYAYPNPVKDKLTVDYVGGDYTVSLIDLSGVVVLHQECTIGRSLIDVTTLAQGFYLLKIESEGKYYFEKIQKK